MARYDVTIKESEIYFFEGVDADSASDAENLAWEMLTKDECAKHQYHHDSDGESNAVEVEVEGNN